MIDRPAWLATLLQVSDSAFPTGGYAHSCGFEQIVHLGLVRDEVTLAAHIGHHLWPMLTHFELPVVRFAHGADLPALLELDALVEATKTAREIREASRATGRRRLHAFVERGALSEFACAVEEKRACGHHAVVFGAGLAHVPLESVLTSWAFQSLSGLCLAAPKLLRMGQDAAQRVLTGALKPMEENIATSLAVTPDEMGWFDPLLDLASMHHEIAHERLFIS